MGIFYKKSFLYDIILFPLIIASVIFRCVVIIRRALYNRGILKSYRSSSTVISVGNLTVGGTGKTPIVIHLCGMLRSKKVAVVSRGYGAKGKGVRIVSDGKALLCGPDECGDEPYLIAKSNKNIIVAVSKTKTEVIKFLELHYKPDVIILDDGFSHLSVKREIEIVLINGYTGFGNNHLLPAGPLREPIKAIKYANVVGIKGDTGKPVSIIKKYKPHGSIFSFNYKVNGIRCIGDNAAVDIRDIKDKKIVAVAGIAFPESFFKLLYSAGLKPFRCIAKSDHYGYTKHKLDKIVAKHKPDIIIVTAKDAVKIERILENRNTMWLYMDVTPDIDNRVLRNALLEKGLL